MRGDVGAVVRGVMIGVAVAASVGALTFLVLTVAKWPPGQAEPTTRARHLGESISAGMDWAMLTSIVMIPACAVFLVRRARARESR